MLSRFTSRTCDAALGSEGDGTAATFIECRLACRNFPLPNPGATLLKSPKGAAMRICSLAKLEAEVEIEINAVLD
jgi:hypothetical protein